MSPILSSRELRILGYDDRTVPADPNELLKSFKASFDDPNISLSDKVVLHTAFTSITNLIAKLSEAKWAAIDNAEFESESLAESGAPQVYFSTSDKVGKTRRSRAIFALTVVVGSKFFCQRTRGSVEYGGYDGLAPVLYRTSMDLSYRMGMKLNMAKSCNGEGGEAYMKGLYNNIGTLIAKAKEGSGRGIGRSVFTDNIPILVNISSAGKIDEILAHFKEFEEEDDGDGDGDGDSSSDEEEDDSDDEEPSLDMILDAASDQFYKMHSKTITSKAIIQSVEERFDISIDGQARKTVKSHLVDLAAANELDDNTDNTDNTTDSTDPSSDEDDM